MGKWNEELELKIAKAAREPRMLFDEGRPRDNHLRGQSGKPEKPRAGPTFGKHTTRPR